MDAIKSNTKPNRGKGKDTKQRKHKQKKAKRQQHVDPDKAGYYPPASRRAEGNIHISKKLTTKILPTLIKEPIINIYAYMDVMTGFHMNFEEKYDEPVGTIAAIDFGFHEKKTGDPLFCVMERQNEKTDRARGFKWNMKNLVANKEELEELYGDGIEPKQICLRAIFASDLNSTRDFCALLNDGSSLEELIGNTDW
eukprot:CAMPEP_0201592796 /NCGR_PEP_ID=MMETSP0190_2-20130828/190595_1 /ASSEMBLY_ACC=CAM_ASM_000263 /TAXON_ID=37353 /ORGANISM="Rosalina sp." /LENGTH=195 /DNA_ID=CAMNT_0048051729 /DNA_START=77 /DNA_END=661 /DNA_ORIENTATION=-